MRFGMLGPLEVLDGSRRVELGRPKQRALFALLLLNANRVVSQDRLIDELWGGEPPAGAAKTLRVYLSCLRAALEPQRPTGMRSNYLRTQPPGYVLRAAPENIDALRFETLVVEGRALLAAGDPLAGRRTLVEALSLWRGPALAEFLFEPFAQGEAARLEELRLAAIEDRLEADLALGRHEGLAAELEAEIAERPLRERLWSMLMLALYRDERQGEALRAFTRARASFTTELGIEPSPELERLEAAILRHDPELDWRPARSADATAPATLVGRQTELGVLQRLVGAARNGRGGVALVSGEPGIGKTRLVQEVTTLARRDGALVAWGRCHEGEGAPTVWPWIQVVRSVLAGLERPVLEATLRPFASELAQIVPEVKELVPDLEPPPAVEPAAARARFYEAANALLSALAAQGTPVIVVLDDLHWADVPSLELAGLVARRAADTGVLLVATFRNVDPAVGGPLATTLDSLEGLPVLHCLGLDGLSPDDCRRFIAATFDVEPSDAVVTAVHARTDGNPFFVGELAPLLAGDQALTGQAEPHADVPEGVRDVIRRRLNRLSPPTNELLALAAVLGREFDLAVLGAAARRPEDEVAALLAAAVDAGLLVEDRTASAAPARYQFFHVLMQETLLGETGLALRAKLHARAAAGVQAAHGSAEDHAFELAHHLYLATPVVPATEAFDAALRAAQVCQGRLAHEQAEGQLRRAVELVARLPAGPERFHRELTVKHRLAALLSATEGYHSTGVGAA